MLHKYKFAGLTFTFDAFCETGFLWHQPFNYISIIATPKATEKNKTSPLATTQ